MPRTDYVDNEYFGMSFNRNEKESVCNTMNLDITDKDLQKKKEVNFKTDDINLTYDKSLPTRLLLKKNFTLQLAGKNIEQNLIPKCNNDKKPILKNNYSIYNESNEIHKNMK